MYDPPFQENIYQLADELRSIATLGLRFAEKPDIEERYAKVMAASARLVRVLERCSAEDVLDRYEGARGRWSPLLVSSAALFRDDRLVLVKRSGTDLWTLPRDVVENGQSLTECAKLSLRDQAAVVGEVTDLMGVFDSRTWRYPSKSQFHQIVFRVEPDSDQSLESDGYEIRLVSEDQVVSLSPGWDPIIPTLFDLHGSEASSTYFDQAVPPSTLTAREADAEVPSQGPAHLKEMYRISRELNGLGRYGTEFPEHPYATERYRHMLSIGTRLTQAAKEWSADEASVLYEDNIGYQGLHVGAFAAAFLNGQILLIRREDTGEWSMPAGAADVGETWANCALRELKEETSVGGKVVDLLALFDFRLFRPPPRPLVMAAFLVEPDPDAEPRMMPETLGARYFPIDELPKMSPRSTAHTAIDLYEGRLPRPYFDLP